MHPRGSCLREPLTRPSRGPSLGPSLDPRGRAKKMATTMTPGGDLETKVKTLFGKMDKDGDGTITKDEASQWFKSFGKISAAAMFNEVDTDKSAGINMEERATPEDGLRPTRC